MQVARAALEMLGVLHEDAAAQNDKLHLFASEERFPRVFQLAAELADAEAALEGLLPGLRKQLGLPRLAYISLANQGDYLVEVPADRRDVPKVRFRAACIQHVSNGILEVEHKLTFVGVLAQALRRPVYS